MRTKLLTAAVFAFGASMPFACAAAYFNGWKAAAIVFGLLYLGFAASLILSLCVIAKDNDYDS